MLTNDEIIKKHSLNPIRAVEQMDCSLDTLMDEARADQFRKDTDERVQSIKEARIETIKKIFAELESIKDEYGNSILDTLYGKGKQYAKLKKKYGVD